VFAGAAFAAAPTLNVISSAIAAAPARAASVLERMIPPESWVRTKGVPVVCKRNVRGMFGVSVPSAARPSVMIEV
jgi:hypothetical protein